MLRMKSLLIVLVLLFLSTQVSAQRGNFYNLRGKRFAKPLAMGSVYTGIATGLEAMYYNPAGLANQKGVNTLASYGAGITLPFKRLIYELPNFVLEFDYSYSDFGTDYNPEVRLSVVDTYSIKEYNHVFTLGINYGI